MTSPDNDDYVLLGGDHGAEQLCLLDDVELEVIQPSYRQGPGKQIASVTMEHIREAVVGAGLASHEEINGIVADLDSFASNPRTMMSMPRIFQVWGKKPN